MAKEEEKRRIKKLFNCKDLLMANMEVCMRLSMKEVATVELSGGESEQPLYQQVVHATIFF